MVVLRSLSEVSGWDPRLPDTARWAHVLDQDAPMGHKLLVAAAGAAISFSDPLGDERPRRFVAIEPESGQLRWKQALAIAPSARGLMACRDHLFVHGYDIQRHSAQLARLDPATGTPLFSVAAETGNACCTRDAILLAGSNAVYSYAHDGTRHPDYRVLESNLAVRDNQVYAHGYVSRSEWGFMWWDGAPKRERARFIPGESDTLDIAQARPGALLAPGVSAGSVAVAPRDMAAGLWLVDIAGQRARWHALAGDEVVAMIATPHGLVVGSRSGQRYNLRALDEASGTVQQEIATRQGVVSALYVLAHGFICAGLGAAEWYSWEE